MPTLNIKVKGGGEIILESTFADKYIKKIESDFGVDLTKKTFAPISVTVDLDDAYKNKSQTSLKLTPEEKSEAKAKAKQVAKAIKKKAVAKKKATKTKTVKNKESSSKK